MVPVGPPARSNQLHRLGKPALDATFARSTNIELPKSMVAGIKLLVVNRAHSVTFDVPGRPANVVDAMHAGEVKFTAMVPVIVIPALAVP